MARDFLLEIGTEEIPARFMPHGLKELHQKAEEFFAKNRLKYKNVKTYGTPRRLALYVTGLEEYQEDLQEEVKGPPYKIAYDSSGNPTKAAEGFARSQRVEVGSLEVKEVDGVAYVFAVHKREGRPVEEILPELIPQVIQSLTFPKYMRWGDKDVRFARPIRWLVSLYGSQVVEFTFGEVRAGRYTRGHRFLVKGEVEISEAGDYLEVLNDSYVVADQNRRKQLIWQEVEELAFQEGGQVKRDEGLLEEVNYLLEYPTALCGSFPERFLDLPEEVLVTTMREHQRYFPVYGKEGRMLPKFITIRNGTADYLDVVKEGNEKVLRARLADAEFFYREDRKSSLAAKVEKLKNVIFQESLGTVYDKCERLQNLVAYLADTLGWEKDVLEAAHRAAYLSKADLVTNMVIEFPELQGIMGYYYAKADGEADEVCTAIREHYMPRFAGDNLPASSVGCLLSIADKIDNIVGCFSVGIQPTGSQDPYALRRQALGICKIIIDFDLNLSLRQLFKKAYEEYAGRVGLHLPFEKVGDALEEFFGQRIANMLEEQGVRYDIVNAVMAAGWDSVADVVKRARALSEFRNDSGFEALLTGYTRAANLSKGAEAREIDPALFEDEVEERLYEAYRAIGEKARKHLASGDYLAALREISNLRGPIDAFFDGVMVMVEDEKLRNNRLALLKSVSKLMAVVGELAEIVPSE